MADLDLTFRDAIAHHEAGRFDLAERGYQALLAAQPNHQDALHLLGLLRQRQGRLDEAIDLVRRAVEALPRFGPFRGTLGALLLEKGDVAGAIAAYQEAIALPPEIADIHNNFGNALLKASLARDAAESYRRAIALRADFSEAHGNLSNALSRLGEFEQAERAARTALDLRPEDARYWLRLSDVLSRQARLDEARVAAQRAVDLERAGRVTNPRGMALALTRLGDVLHRMHRTQDALEAYQSAIAIDPHTAEARCSAAGVLSVQGLVAESIAMSREALRLRPDMTACHSNMLWTLHSDPRYGAKELLDEHVAWARQHTAGRGQNVRHDNDRDPHRRLRVGYISGDFREHSTCRFYLPLLENHDKRHVNVLCYSTIEKSDDITNRVRNVADEWRDVGGLSDDELAEVIRRDRVDLLIDLPGHTGGNRLTALAHKPAPVQASWLGWLGTTGLPQIDYWIADALTVPHGEEKYFAERVYRLRAPFLCYGPPQGGPAVTETPVLRNGYVTFGSFNNLGKLSPALMESWAKILNDVPNSRLLLKALVLADDRTREKVLPLLARHGVPVDRVDLMPPEAETSRHLAAYGRVDVGLDMFPFNGATTTAEALWMGVPVVTMAGNSHVSRVGLSLVTSVGFGELCANDVNGYVATAVKLGIDVDRIRRLRETMRQRMETSPLMDGKGFAIAMEEAYRTMWRRWCESAQ